MLPGLVLHIGTEKTGSTTIQRFLRRNRKKLLKHGVLFPQSAGRENQAKLAVYAGDDRQNAWLIKWCGIKDMQAFREGFSAKLAAELRKHKPQRVIMSNEHCQSRLAKPEQIRKLHELLAPHFSRITIMCYLRRQDLMAASAWSTSILSSSHEQGMILERNHYLLDYLQLYRNWAEVFGAQNIIMRRFSPSQLVEGDVVRDFCHTLQLRDLPLDYTREARNTSCSAAALLFVNQLNLLSQQHAGCRKIKKHRDEALRFISKNFRGSALALDRQAARDYYAHFADDNVELARLLQLEQALFDDDFSMYVDDNQYSVNLKEQALAVAACCFCNSALD